ncbi:MAG: CUAEP/CCAEP-tail radical SAM (seleno)protein, partial [Terriglobia bacterium]
MNVLLISTYELGHQPFGLASPAAWLERAGMTVTCMDLSREPLREEAVMQAGFIAFYLPMHTATRLAIKVLPQVRRLNPSAHLCFYGLYAPLNATYLRSLGAQTVLGGEFEEEMVRAAARARDLPSSGGPAQEVQQEPLIPLARLQFIPPRRQGLPSLKRYARLELPEGGSRVVGYTEASRGC